MGSIAASVLIARAHELAQDDATDEAEKTWTTAQALGWLNEGQLAICQLKPDAKSVTRNLKLTAGTTKQSVSSRQLLAVIRNMGADGATPGRAIRLVDRGLKDEADPDWHSATPASAVREYVMDDRDKQVFYVSPPPDSAFYIEVTEAINPTDVADTADPIDIDDSYAPALVEWICYRFFGRDSEETPNFGRAGRYLQNFYNLLQVRTAVDVRYSPKQREQLE